MDSRERTFLALNHEEPDRVPIDLWMSSGFRARLQAEQNVTPADFLDVHDIDLRYIRGPRYIGPALQADDGVDVDIWGVARREAQVQTSGGQERYMEVAASPLTAATRVEQIEEYEHWPSPDWFDYSPIAAQCEAVHAAGRVAVFMGDRLNRLAQLKPAMYLRGVEQIFIDLALHPDLARAVIGRIRAFYEAYAERIFAAAAGSLDLLLTGDDFGSQNGPLLSPSMWQEFLREGFTRYIDLAHSYGIKVLHHTCGAVRPLIPLLADSGLDVLQSLQPEADAMDPLALKADFGDRLSFHGGLSIQRTLPFGTAEDVRAEVRACLAALAPGGGYILGTAHNLQSDVPTANALAMLDAHRQFGGYPIFSRSGS